MTRRSLKDNTYDEIYGAKALEIKNKIRDSMKGKLLEEILGPERAAAGRLRRKEIAQQKRELKYGNDNIRNKKL